MNPLLRDELAALIAEEMSMPVAERAQAATKRDALMLRIQDLQAMYSLGWLVRQETMHVFGVVECLDDQALAELLAMLERGVEAIHDGVPFVEVGLVRGATCNWVA
ncbi:hypothetical protein [Stenotrophomonas sp. SORGH_AS_0321]|uniref:hypothetical protein n=1 Tax=Stenotrophomonas sp. SORGH_AS_0321 TaxID=3041787 RepID=UPI002862E6EB|nr:hypothetical protein [Stenotrophomonas sp. SORGH_AS_0321]MDR6094926.1 hypothetical protein [Stenotrophomonas sp. SORGH_AS_0321]